MRLSERPARSIVRAVAGAAERWSDGDFPPRVRLLDAIVARTGYSLPVVEYALDRIFFSLGERDIEAVIAAELGSVEALDGFVERGASLARAMPVGRVCIVSSRTTIGVAIVPAVFALCAKCDVLVKDREDGLVASFFATLAQELDELGDAARALAWNGERDARDLGDFDAVVAFGSESSLANIRSALRADARFVAFGPGASAGYVGRDALESEARARATAEGAARDAMLYDGEGCLSLHALFVERGATVAPETFASYVASAIERGAVEFPASAADPGMRARVAHARDLAAFRAASGSGAVYSDAAASYLAALDPPPADPPPFLARTLPIRSVDGPSDALAYLRAHRVPLEALAVAGSREDIVAMASSARASRIAAFGELQAPPLHAFHGGRPRIAEFVRWISRDR